MDINKIYYIINYYNYIQFKNKFIFMSLLKTYMYMYKDIIFKIKYKKYELINLINLIKEKNISLSYNTLSDYKKYINNNGVNQASLCLQQPKLPQAQTKFLLNKLNNPLTETRILEEAKFSLNYLANTRLLKEFNLQQPQVAIGTALGTHSLNNLDINLYSFLKNINILNIKKNSILFKNSFISGFNFNSKQNPQSLSSLSNVFVPQAATGNLSNNIISVLTLAKVEEGLTNLRINELQKKENIKFLSYIKNEYKEGWYLLEDIQIFLNYFFKSIYSLISKPKFLFTADKIIIQLFYFVTIPDINVFKWYDLLFMQCLQPQENKNLNTKINLRNILNKNFKNKKILFNLNNNNISKVYGLKFKLLSLILSNYFKKTIELNLIRLHQSEYDSNILVNLFSLIIKKKNIKIAIDKLFYKNSFNIFSNMLKPTQKFLNNEVSLSPKPPAFISGLTIKIGGRLMREPIIPRITTKKFEKGNSATGKINLLDVARLTKKNKKGAFTIKLIYAQNSYLA